MAHAAWGRGLNHTWFTVEADTESAYQDGNYLIVDRTPAGTVELTIFDGHDEAGSFLPIELNAKSIDQLISALSQLKGRG